MDKTVYYLHLNAYCYYYYCYYYYYYVIIIVVVVVIVCMEIVHQLRSFVTCLEECISERR